ncbi:MAG: hypothetical protein ABFD60_04170 [Bryobacteraceae bacterium]
MLWWGFFSIVAIVYGIGWWSCDSPQAQRRDEINRLEAELFEIDYRMNLMRGENKDDAGREAYRIERADLRAESLCAPYVLEVPEIYVKYNDICAQRKRVRDELRAVAGK